MGFEVGVQKKHKIQAIRWVWARFAPTGEGWEEDC